MRELRQVRSICKLMLSSHFSWNIVFRFLTLSVRARSDFEIYERSRMQFVRISIILHHVGGRR